MLYFGSSILASIRKIIIYTLIIAFFIRKELYELILEYTSKKDAEKTKKKSDEASVIPNVRFEDVIGIEEYKDEVVDIVNFLKDPSMFAKIGAEMPKGILLAGPPGTGKTLLAKALAREAGCSFFYLSGSEIDKFFVGAGARKLRDVFAQARKKSPAIVFIDEIDAVAMDRAKSTSIMQDFSTINQLLVEMDGFNGNEKIIVIGATNMPDRLDRALMRPGRFDKTINIPLPDVKGREKLFDFYIKKITTSEKIDSALLAQRTTRMSGADIANIVNKAIVNAVKNKKTEGATNKDFETVIEQHYLGVRRSQPIPDENLKRHMAVYEAAKAVTSLVYPSAEPVFKMTILSRGDVDSQTITNSTEDKLNYNKKEIKAHLMTALAGRAAELIYFGEISSKCSEDYKRAVNLCMQYMKKMAMNEQLSLVSADKKEMSDLYNADLEKAAGELLTEFMVEANSLVLREKDKIEMLAGELIKRETLDLKEIKKLLNIS